MNKQLILVKRPVGMPDKDTWALREGPVPVPAEGEVLIKQEYVSLDPAMRGWMDDRKSYIDPVGIDEVMRAGSVGKVIKSNGHPEFREGDFLSGWGGVQQYTVTEGRNWYRVDPTLAPLPTYIGTLGMPGMTAYFGLLEVGRVKEGEVVLISGAAGAVGSTVGQIAKIKGCKVIGIAGSETKCKYLTDELGFDAAIDYKSENVRKSIEKYCPEGIDVFFDNVGGDVLDTALTQLRRHARIVLCGAISQYNNTKPKGPDNYLSLIIHSATMQGMVVMDYAKDYGKAAMELAQWMAQGSLKSKEDVYEGIENFHETFQRLFTGEKFGKLVLKVSED